jgi:hypothetical protein
VNLRKDHCTHKLQQTPLRISPLSNPHTVFVCLLGGLSWPFSQPQHGVLSQPIALCINTSNMTEYKTKGLRSLSCNKQKQLSATDILALATMKNAAKCDT